MLYDYKAWELRCVCKVWCFGCFHNSYRSPQAIEKDGQIAITAMPTFGGKQRGKIEGLTRSAGTVWRDVRAAYDLATSMLQLHAISIQATSLNRLNSHLQQMIPQQRAAVARKKCVVHSSLLLFQLEYLMRNICNMAHAVQQPVAMLCSPSKF